MPLRREERSLRQQFIEHGFDDRNRPSRTPLRNSRLSETWNYPWVTQRGALATTAPDAVPETADTVGDAETIRDRARETLSDWDLLDANSPYEVFRGFESRPLGAHGHTDLLDWLEPTPNIPRTTPPPDEPLLAVLPMPVPPPDEPPVTLDRASAVTSPSSPARERSRSSSPNAASRAWLAEYTAGGAPHSSGTVFSIALGRRQREEEDEPFSVLRSTSARRRTLGNDFMGDVHNAVEGGPPPAIRRRYNRPPGRDTRRDAVVMEPPEGWLESMQWGIAQRERPRYWSLAEFPMDAWRSDDGNEDGEDGAPLTRTMSLSAVGRGDRPIAPLPRRQSSTLNAE